MARDKIMLTGANGSTATGTQADAIQSNGVIHVVNGVLTPKDIDKMQARCKRSHRSIGPDVLPWNVTI